MKIYQRILSIIAEERPQRERDRWDPDPSRSDVGGDSSRAAEQGAGTEAPTLTRKQKAKERRRLRRRSLAMLRNLRSRRRPPVTAKPQRAAKK